ncbi:MAG: HTTM domain-containing protein [Ilumatobacter sp.]|uniref:HTTM domain-containing protein n=1 Tax=Ilumatobacter sp. TaxID=1967498 RepID=UPI0032983FE3
MSEALRTFGHRLFVAERSAWPLAIARVVIGVAILLWTLTMMLDLRALLGDDALVGVEFADDLDRFLPLDSTLTVGVALLALITAGIAIIVGWRPSLWLVVAFVLLVAIQRRNTMILNSGDIILRNLTLLLALTPTGAAMSVDRIRRHGRAAFWTSAQVAPWGLRVVQLQMIVVYFFAFWSKSGELWQNGTAVSTAFRLQDLQRFGEWSVLVDDIWVVAFLTWSTLVVELALGTLLWVRRLRPALIVFGVLLHVMIDTFVLVGFFGIAMVAGLATFLDADRLDTLVARRRADRAPDVEPITQPAH